MGLYDRLVPVRATIKYTFIFPTQVKKRFSVLLALFILLAAVSAAAFPYTSQQAQGALASVIQQSDLPKDAAALIYPGLLAAGTEVIDGNFESFSMTEDVQKIEALTAEEMATKVARPVETPLTYARAVFDYKDPIARTIVLEIKYC